MCRCVIIWVHSFGACTLPRERRPPSWRRRRGGLRWVQDVYPGQNMLLPDKHARIPGFVENHGDEETVRCYYRTPGTSGVVSNGEVNRALGAYAPGQQLHLERKKSQDVRCLQTLECGSNREGNG